jgi:hypothetical protein
MSDVNLETVKEITKTIRELNTDRAWQAGIVIILIMLTILVLYLCIAINHKQSAYIENNSFCSTKKDTVYVMPMQLKIYQDSIQTKEGGSKWKN